MKRETALAAKTLALSAIKELTKILYITDDESDLDSLKRAVGSCIAGIHMEILLKIYSEYPDLDDLHSS